MDLTAYRSTERERQRTQSLLNMLTPGESVLEIGARDGHFSRLLTQYFSEVTALDLAKPPFTLDRVTPVAGDVRKLAFPDRSFDCVFCTEVLEHVDDLEQAAHELARVARTHLIIGVPYKQDLRWGRTTCRQCRYINPAWGHLHCFDKQRLISLFPEFEPKHCEFVWLTKGSTNWLSTALLDFSGNPWGEYNDEDRCLNCGAVLSSPPVTRTLFRRACSGLAAMVNTLQEEFQKASPFWIHIAFARKEKQ